MAALVGSSLCLVIDLVHVAFFIFRGVVSHRQLAMRRKYEKDTGLKRCRGYLTAGPIFNPAVQLHELSPLQSPATVRPVCQPSRPGLTLAARAITCAKTETGP